MMICTKLFSALAILLIASLARAATYAPCPDSDALPILKGSVCTTVIMPLSYADLAMAPATEIRLFVRQFPAKGPSKGTVWLVAGGPGESGASLYPMLDVLRSSFPDFDLMIPDHRGTGYSSRLCPREESVDSPGGAALAGAEWGSCPAHLAEHPERAGNFSMTTAAYDLKNLISTSNLDKPVYVYGVSYGTQLVLRTLQLGKTPITGVILDSLVPLQTAAQWDLSHRSHAVDDVGRTVLAGCDKDTVCHRMMGQKAETVYRRVLAMMREQPILLAKIPGKDLKRFLGSMLDVPEARSRIPYLIKDLELARGQELETVLQTLQDAGKQFGEFPQSPPSIPLVSIISASENNLRPNLTADDLKKEDETLLFASRLPELLVQPLFPSYPRDEYFGKVPTQFPPVLVFAGMLDPKTPYDGALSHIAALKKFSKVGLVSLPSAPHFILWSAPACFTRYARNFVQGGTLADHHCGVSKRRP
ncbi:alpha/beta fold hydrolase [Massilia sp. TSP1-1-2]|uniref:alpha/beta fold hydrolase n=1 Tax=Massilia sp. TSP1-1-2 TaxID=2804649 RepID=UPI003CF461F3